jgi:hypothetical protein
MASEEARFPLASGFFMVDDTKFFLVLLRRKTLLFPFPLSPTIRLESYVKCMEFMGVESLVFFHLLVFLSSTFFLSVSFLYMDLDRALKLLAMRPSERKILISVYP